MGRRLCLSQCKQHSVQWGQLAAKPSAGNHSSTSWASPTSRTRRTLLEQPWCFCALLVPVLLTHTFTPKLTTHCPLMSFWHMSSPRPPRIPNKQRKRSINPSSRTSSQPSSEPFILQIVPQHTDPRFLFLFLHLSDHHQGE